MKRERASDDFLIEMAVDPDSLIDGFSKVEIPETEKTGTESLDLKEMDGPDIRETVKMEVESPDLNEWDDEEEKVWKAFCGLVCEEEEDGVTCCYNRFVFHISEKVSEESLKSVWKEKVEPLFKERSLSCELDWLRCKMIVGKKTPFVRYKDLKKGACALALLSYPSLPSEWFPQIFSDKVHCACIRLTLPDDMRHLFAVRVEDSGFSKKYAMFREKVFKSGLLRKLSCTILYAGKAIFVYSSDPRSPDKMGDLVNWCLLNNSPLEEQIELLLLDDEDDDDGRGDRLEEQIKLLLQAEKDGVDDVSFAQQMRAISISDLKDPEAERKYWHKKYLQKVIAYKEMKAETDRSVAACKKLKAEIDQSVARAKARGGRAGRGGARGRGAGRGGARGGEAGRGGLRGCGTKRTTTSSSSGASRPRDPHKSHGHEHGTNSIVRRNPVTKVEGSQQTYSRIPIPTISQVIGRPTTTRAVHGSSSDTKRSIELPATQIVQQHIHDTKNISLCR